MTRRLREEWDRLDRETIERLQAQALRRFLREQVIPHSAHYRDLFRREGINPGAIRSLGDLRQIPFTSKEDLLGGPARTQDFLFKPDEAALGRRPGVVLRALVRGREQTRHALAWEYRPIFLTSTTGRSAEPTPFLFSGHDLDNLSSGGVRLVSVLGATPEWRVVNMFPFAPHLAFWQAHYAMIAFGVFAVSTGGGKVLGTDGNLRAIEKVKPQALIGMPTFLYHLLLQAVEEGRRIDTLKTLVLGGEKAPAGMRRKLRQLAAELGSSDARVVATYGFTEAKAAWGECPHPIDAVPGGYHLYPDLGLFEVINPASGEVRGPGQPGELVFTPLNARGTVVVRYRTGDVIDGGLEYGPCPHCGRRCPRLVGNITRRSEVRELRFDKIKGTLVDFNTLEHVLDDADHVGAWQLEIRKVNDDPLEIDELILHLQRIGHIDEEDLARQVNRRVESAAEMHLNEIHFHSASEMRALQGVGHEIKERRLVDNRAHDGEPLPPRTQSLRGWRRLFHQARIWSAS